MSTGLRLRPVKEADFRAVSELLAASGRPALTPETEGGALAAFRRHVAYLNTASLLAEREGVPVGFLALHFRERLNYPTLEAWVPDLAVASHERNSGVASALFERAILLARGRSCHRLVLESDPGRERPYQLRTPETVAEAGRLLVVELL